MIPLTGMLHCVLRRFDQVIQRARVMKIRALGVVHGDLDAVESDVFAGTRRQRKGANENAAVAFAICLSVGLSADQIREGLFTFQGVKRRFDYQLRTEQIIFIDDYAHHPEELNAAIGSVKELYPGKKILGIFQPHLYSRTRDFADGFAESLDQVDELILLPIYPARELPMEGVSSEMIMQRMKNKNVRIMEKEEVMNWLKHNKTELLITAGAGDIDNLVGPIKQIVNN